MICFIWFSIAVPAAVAQENGLDFRLDLGREPIIYFPLPKDKEKGTGNTVPKPPESFEKTRHLYEIMPQSFFREIDRLSELPHLHDPGLQVPIDGRDQFFLRLNVRGLDSAPRRPEEVNFVWGIGYRFGGGKPVAPEHRDVSSPTAPSGNHEMDEQLFSLLVPSDYGRSDRVISVTLNFEAGDETLTRRHRKILGGLIAYLNRHPDTIIVISGKEGPSYRKRVDEVVRYLTGEGKIGSDRVKVGPIPKSGAGRIVEIRLKDGDA